MSLCGSCLAEVQADSKFCTACRAPLAPSRVSAIPAAVRPAPGSRPIVNSIAILAFVLACLGGAPALVFGHIAQRRIRDTGERGMALARVATVLGYLWLILWVALAIWWVTDGPR